MPHDARSQLSDGSPEADTVAEAHIGHTQTDEVAAPQLAGDDGVEQGGVAGATRVLRAGRDRPEVLGLAGGSRA